PGVDNIAFTGSSAVGLGIIEAAAKTPPSQRNVKRVVAEMGGKNSIIVDDDADLDQAMSGVLLDRKSTRLNSSHEWLSYAVFCFKKTRNLQRVFLTGPPGKDIEQAGRPWRKSWQLVQ